MAGDLALEEQGGLLKVMLVLQGGLMVDLLLEVHTVGQEDHMEVLGVLLLDPQGAGGFPRHK